MDLFEEISEKSDLDHDRKGKAVSRNDNRLTYDEGYAQNYERRKRGEELMKLKEKYGQDYEPSESDEDFSSEDSDAEFITPEVDAAILKTLARIKKSDPKLYEGNEDVFQAEEAENLAIRATKLKKSRLSPSRHQKPVHLRDYQRKALLKGTASDLDGNDLQPHHIEPTPAEEARALYEETKRAFHNPDVEIKSEDADDILDLLIPRSTGKAEVEQDDDEDFKQFLLDRVGSDDIQTALRLSTKPEQDLVQDQKHNLSRQDDDDDFLRNYVLGRGWIDKEAKKIPKYAEIVHSKARLNQITSGPSGANANVLGKTVIDEGLDDEDEEFVERAEQFETEYNFSAEPTITTHIRTIDTSVRRKDETRKLARDAAKARKQAEKQARQDELNRLKELKRKEVMEKLDVIRKNAGLEDFDVDAIDLDSDFDPDKHDNKMSQVFDDGFYTKKDPDGKPVWDDDIEIDNIIPTNLQQDDINFEPGGDAYDPSAPSQKSSKRQKRLDKKKRKSCLEDTPVEEECMPDSEVIQDMAGLTPTERKEKLLKALDDYYRMDYEDMIGDLPTRFKYTKTQATDLLTPAQILMATDAELNEVIGLKKLAPYRTRPDKSSTSRKKKLKELREKLKKRTWGESIATTGISPHGANDNSANQDSKRHTKKRKGKKERQKQKDTSCLEVALTSVPGA